MSDPRSPDERDAWLVAPEEDGRLHDDDLDAVREALDELRRDIRRRLPVSVSAGQGDAIDAPPAWVELVSLMRSQLASLGMRERSGEIDALGLDPNTLARFAPWLDFLVDHYWRVTLSGADHLPRQGPCLLVANHSGLLPWDGLVLAHLLARELDGERPRFFVADWLMTLPFAMPTLTRLGGVRACRENAEWLLHDERFAIVFPEGAKGATKVFR